MDQIIFVGELVGIVGLAIASIKILSNRNKENKK